MIAILNLLLLASLSAQGSVGHQLPFSRWYDPVVLTGSDLPELIGAQIDSIVAFQQDENGNWNQIPIQIDERHIQYWDVIKKGDCRQAAAEETNLI